VLKYIKPLVAGCLLLGFSGTVATATTTFNFTGHWQISQPLTGSFSGSFSFDPSTLGSLVFLDFTTYSPVSFTLDAFADTSTVIAFNNGFITVDNDATSYSGSDLFQVGLISGSYSFPAADALESYLPGSSPDVDGITINLLSSSVFNVLTDEDLNSALVAAQNLSAWSSALLAVTYHYTDGSGDTVNDVVLGDLTSLEAAAAVPLPATLPLFGAGLGALGLLGWRRQRKAAA
jgi:hypothetical protein